MARYQFTQADRRRGGLATASKPAPADCEICQRRGYTRHLQHAGHLGFEAFARKYASGDLTVARSLLGITGAASTDPAPSNGAFARGHAVLTMARPSPAGVLS